LNAGTNETSSWPLQEKLRIPSGDCRSGLTIFAVARMAVWSGTAVSYSALRTLHRVTFGNSTHVLS